MGPVNVNEKDSLVSSLFQPNSREWNLDKIRDTLPEWEQQILCIRPSKKGAPDSILWLKSGNGHYTTKSGYITALSGSFKRNDTSTGSNIRPFGWIKTIWEKKIPTKLKLLVWKANHNALPVGERLWSRSIVQSPACKVCGEPETIRHVFFDCVYAKKVWDVIPLSDFSHPPTNLSFNECWSAIITLKNLPPTGLNGTHLAPWVVWSLWITRNHRLFQDRHFSELETAEKAIINAKEWQDAQLIMPAHITRQERTTRGSPLPRTVVCNTDAAWCLRTKTTGLAAIFHQHNQASIKLSRAERFVHSPLMAECLSIREAMERGMQLGFSSLIIETDSQIIAKAWIMKNQISELYGVMEDLKLLAENYSFFEIKFINRSLNGDADTLAKQSLHSIVMNLS